ncbi:MAG: helix-turn-helix transcriptional regulator [Pseudomonadota bacterium]
MSKSSHLGENLRFLCAEKSSIAKVCREIEINQQQFSKYLAGRAHPSAYNLRRIAKYFGLDEQFILGPYEKMVAAYRGKQHNFVHRRGDPFSASFPGDITKLRSHLGAYQVFFRAPVIPEGVVVNAIFLNEKNAMVYSRLIEVIGNNDSSQRRWTRCDGMASYQSGRLFIVDSERRNENALSMYILTPQPRQRGKYLFGTTCFLASLPMRTPHASKVAFKRFEEYRSARELLNTCGIYAGESPGLDPNVKRYLFSDA